MTQITRLVNSAVLRAMGRVPHRDPLLTNYMSNLAFLGTLNSVVISISSSEAPVEKSLFQIGLPGSRSGRLNTQITNGSLFRRFWLGVAINLR